MRDESTKKKGKQGETILEDNVGGREKAEDAFNNVKGFFSSVTPNFLKTPIKKIINIRNGTGSDADDEQPTSETDEKSPSEESALKKKVRSIKDGTKSFVNGVGHFFVNTAEYAENKFRSRTELTLNDRKELVGHKNILFKSEEIKREQERAENEARNTRNEIEQHKKAVEADNYSYLYASIDADIKKYNAEKEAKKKELDDLKASEKPDPERIKALQDEINKYDVNSKAIDAVLKRAGEKAESDRSRDTVKRGEQYDYKKKALKEALEQKNLKDDQKMILEGAQKRYHEQQVADMGIINGIKQIFASYDSSWKHMDELAKAIEKKDSKKSDLIRNAQKEKYGTAAKLKAAGHEALERAKKRAKYLEDNPAESPAAEAAEAAEKQEKDYIQMALDEAATTAHHKFKTDSEGNAPEAAVPAQQGENAEANHAAAPASEQSAANAEVKKAAGIGLAQQGEDAGANHAAAPASEQSAANAEAKKSGGAEQQSNSGEAKESEPFEEEIQGDVKNKAGDKNEVTIGEALDAAQNEYNEEKKKISDAKKEKADKYNVDEQIKKDLKPLDDEITRITELRDGKYGEDAKTKEQFDEEINKLKKKKAEVALQTQKRIEEAKQARDKRKEEKAKRKAEEGALEIERQLNAALAEAEAANKAKAEAANKAKAEAANKAKAQVDQQSEQPGERRSDESSGETTEDSVMHKWFDSIKPEPVKYRGSSKRFSVYDDDDDDDDDDESERIDPDEAEKREKNFENSKKAIEKIRDVDDMSNVMNLYIKDLKSEISNDVDDADSNSVIKRLKQRHKNKENRNHNRQIINELENNLNRKFALHSVPLKRLHQKLSENAYSDWEPGLPYVMELSSLLDDLHKSLNYAKVRLSNEGVARSKSEQDSTQSDNLAKKIETIMNDRLNAPLFRKLAKEFLLNQKIKMKDAYGETVRYESGKRAGEEIEFNPFEHLIGGSGYRGGHYPSITDSSGAISAGQCYMGALRTMINVCNAQTQLDPGASRVVKSFVNECKKVVESANTLGDKQITTSINDLQQKLNNEQMTNKLTGGKAGNNQSKNGKKISAIMDLLIKFAKDTSDKKVIQEIQTKLKEFNNFSDLGINAGDVSQYVRKLYEPTSDYEYVPEA